MTIGNLPAQLDLVAVQASDLVIEITVTENDAAYNFTGVTIDTTIFNLDGVALTTDFTQSITSNTITLTLTDTDTNALAAGSFRWDLTATANGITTPWLAGNLLIAARGFGDTTTTATTTLEVVTTSVTLDITVGVGAIPTVKSSIYIQDNATATVLNQNVATKVSGTFLAGPTCTNCTYNSNRITYTNARSTRVMAVASVDIDGSNNQTFLVAVHKNGTAVSGASVKIRKGTAIATGSLVAMIDLAQNDYVELFITNTTSNADPTVTDATLVLMN